MLVPLDRLDDFSAAIDGLQLRGRLTFEGVELDLPDRRPGRPGAGRRQAALQGLALLGLGPGARRGAGAQRAVRESAADGLAGAGFRVTLAGQTRNGRRGAHGRNDTRSIIGFSNEDAIADVDAELAELEERLVGARRARSPSSTGGSRVLEQLSGRRTTPSPAARFDDFDVDGSDRRIAELERRRTEILDADDQLQALQTRRSTTSTRTAGGSTPTSRFTPRAAAARAQRRPRRAGRLRGRGQGPAGGHGGGRPGRAQPRSRRPPWRPTSRPPRRPPTPTTSTGSPRTPSGSPSGSARRSRVAEAEINRVDDELAAIFRMYKFQWDSPNLGATADSYPDYARILDEIRGKGLADRRSEWRRRLTEWSGQDLVPLVGAMAASIEEIEDRLEPINAILRRLEFGGVGRPAPDPAAPARARARPDVHEGPARPLVRLDDRAGRGRPGEALRRAQPLHAAAAQAQPGRRRRDVT